MPAAIGTSLLELVNDVAKSVGHPATASVGSSQDEAILRMQFYANMCGNELVYLHNWDGLSKTGTISVAADSPGQREKAFDLPPDFKCMTDDTQWNSSTQLPAVGPISGQDWQVLVVRDALITTRFMWRLRQGKLWIKSPPVTPQPFTFEYMSRNWALSGDADTPQDRLIVDNDYHTYPAYLMLLFTRYKWFENEGYDSTGAKNDFDKAFAWFAGTDSGATVLNLVPGSAFPYLTVGRNLPDTGYGQ